MNFARIYPLFRLTEGRTYSFRDESFPTRAFLLAAGLSFALIFANGAHASEFTDAQDAWATANNRYYEAVKKESDPSPERLTELKKTLLVPAETDLKRALHSAPGTSSGNPASGSTETREDANSAPALDGSGIEKEVTYPLHGTQHKVDRPLLFHVDSAVNSVDPQSTKNGAAEQKFQTKKNQSGLRSNEQKNPSPDSSD